MPETSIVVRAFNEEKHIGNLLRAIRSQTYSNYEVILVDSGSTDNTLNIAKEYCDKIIEIESRDFTYGYSLNVGTRNCNGEYIGIISAHALPIDEKWLGNLVAPFQDPNVAMVYGKHVGSQGTKLSESRDFSKIFHATSLKKLAPDYYANNANSAIKKSLWNEFPFDEYLTGLEDIAWAKNFMDQGYAIVYQPSAAVFHIHDESWHQVYNRYRREALAAKRIGLSEPPHGGKGLWRFTRNVLGDVGSVLSSGNASLVSEAFRFRFEQWRGARDGWREHIDPQRERYDLYYSGVNQGVVISGRHSASLKEVPMPELRPGDVLIKVAYVGVGQSDLDMYDGKFEGRNKGRTKFPIVPGCEFSGEVVHVGANTSHFQVGDKVVGEACWSCGVCEFCTTGVSSACSKRTVLGSDGLNGAYVRFLSAPAKHVHKIPAGMDLAVACRAEPLAATHRGIQSAGHYLKNGTSKCAVLGTGAVAQMCMQALGALGHAALPLKIEDGRATADDDSPEVNTGTNGIGQFHLIVETTGQSRYLRQVLNQTRPGSTILLLGSGYGTVDYDFANLVREDLVLVGSVGADKEDFAWAIETLPRLQTTSIEQTILPLEEFNEAWSLYRSDKHPNVILKVD